MIIGIIIAVVVVILAFWLISAYNNFVKMKNKIEEAFATMDVYLKKRWDLVPNLVNTVKGYAEHEKSTFDAITKLRSKSYDSMSANEKVETNQALGGMLGTLIATAEAYPELKANQNFLELQKNLNELENDIADSRKYYNGCVRQMNTAVESFPSNIIAGMFHFEKYRMYEVDDASERQNVVVDFGNAGQAQ
ncbi:MAG: LemA family protein [Bacillota bacterium]|nr:LemA family protein [Clostridiales bacterium]MDD6764922.1 LemA family protein [Bacillota bacterium]MDY5606716.1 LemA family protein [Lentihominibacter sp.]MCI7393019.1 LemA family protein [Clostridiales bacterium]MDD6979500.1 LemA family protein [Bacillota bacterium]